MSTNSVSNIREDKIYMCGDCNIEMYDTDFHITRIKKSIACKKCWKFAMVDK